MVVIKRPLKPGHAAAPLAGAPPTLVAGAGNPVFDTDPTVYAEAKRQLELIDRNLSTMTKDGTHPQNLLHVLRGILDADQRGVGIRTADREEFLTAEEATIPQTEQLLAELEAAGYLEIAARRKRNHDYRPSQAAHDTWNRVTLYEGISPLRPTGYRSERSEEHYLVPFDARTYLDVIPSGDPRDLPMPMSGFHLIPRAEGTVAVRIERDQWSRNRGSKLVFLDLRDQELKPGDYRTAYHERLYRYMDLPTLADQLDALLAMAHNRTKTLVPRYTVKNGPRSRHDSTLIFRDTRGQHYQIPEEFLLYLYNNYYGEDLDIRVSSKPTGMGVATHATARWSVRTTTPT